MDSSTERPQQGYHYEDQLYDPVQYHELAYNAHPAYLMTPQYKTPAPIEYIIPWESETVLTHATTSKSPPKVSWFDRLNDGWTPEIASEVFSVVSLLAMIILLSRLEGRPLSTCTIAVSPNAVIAILSIASKALLIYALGQTISQLKWLHLIKKPDSLEVLQHYDDASRGPLGAVRMFWTVRSASLVAYLGCLTILLALAFEPFSQQLLHFDERVMTYPDLQSSVSFSTVYDFQAEGVDGGSAVIDNPMTAATVNGVYDIVKDPPFSCPGSTLSASIIRFPEDTSTGRSTMDNWMATMQAYECILSFCGRRYSSWNTTNGSLSRGEEQVIKLNNSDSAGGLRVLAPLDPSDSLGTSDGNNSFWINFLDGENLASILTSVFTRQQIGAVGLYSSPDIIATMDNVAKGMSYRMMSGPSSTTINGEVYGTQTYIRVRWPWITLLVALAVASSFCLIAAIIMTRQTKRRIWKSSLTPFLFSDVLYTLTSASERPFRDYKQFQARSRTFASHLRR
ncbi:hypothetical protein HD806DRAFT_551205 [Xylariaceae sp. AK1471]|nr:hypothetical protein HD806DRAFT_551205 [Xylariaceae sp. AK1471]